MDLFVVLAAASLGTARVVLPAGCSPCAPTGSLMVAFLSLDQSGEPIFFASSTQCSSSNAVDSASLVVATAGDNQQFRSFLFYSWPAPLFETQSVAIAICDQPSVIHASSSQCSIVIATDSASVSINFHAPRARRHPWHSDAMCFQSPTRIVGGHLAVLDICDELAVVSVVSTQCSVLYAVDSIFAFDAPGARNISAVYYDAHLLGFI